jgi:8-amino-7-oxononanoate synthase
MSAIHAANAADYAAALHALSKDDRLRGLKPRAGIDFVSNDYLALANAPRRSRITHHPRGWLGTARRFL